MGSSCLKRKEHGPKIKILVKSNFICMNQIQQSVESSEEQNIN